MKYVSREEFSVDEMHHTSQSDSTRSQDKPAIGEQHAGHDRHAGHSVAMLRDTFWWTLIFTIPVVVWSADVQHWLGYNAPSFPGSKWIPAIFGTGVFAYGGSVFLHGACYQDAFW